MGLIACAKASKLFSSKEVAAMQDKIDILVNQGNSVIEAEALVKLQLVDEKSAKIVEELQAFIESTTKIITKVEAPKQDKAELEKAIEETPKPKKQAKPRAKKAKPAKAEPSFDTNLAFSTPEFEPLAAPVVGDIVETPEVIEPEVTQAPITEVGSVVQGQEINVEGEPELVEKIEPKEESFTVTTRNRMTGKRIARPIQQIEPKVSIVGERDFVKEPPIPGERVMYKGKEYTVHPYKSSPVLIDENGDYEFPEVKDLSEPESIIAAKEQALASTNTSRDKIVAVAHRMSQLFPTLKMEIDNFSWDEMGRFENGIVKINLRTADITTPIHEFLHPFLYAIKQENPGLYASLVNEMMSYPEYSKILNEVSSNKTYAKATAEDLQEEVLVRILTDKVSYTLNEDGKLDEAKVNELQTTYGDALSNMIRAIVAFIEKLVNSFRAGSEYDHKARVIRNITGIEYDVKTNKVKVFKKGQKDALVYAQATIKDTHVDLRDLIVKLKEKMPAERIESLKMLHDDIKDQIERTLSILNGEFGEEEKATLQTLLDGGQNRIALNLGFKEQVAKYEQRVYRDVTKAPLTNEIYAQDLAAIPKDTSLETLAALLATSTLHEFHLNKYEEDFKTLETRFFSKIKTKEELLEFTNKFRKSLVNMQHSLEKRFRAGSLAPEMKDSIISTLAAIQPLSNKDFLTDDNFLEVTTDIVREGFMALAEANRMMLKIKTKVEFGSVQNYVDNLQKNLIESGITVKINDKLFYGIRISSGKVELNPNKIIADGLIYTDITKFISGALKSNEFIKKVQQANTDARNALTTDLTQDEIKSLNWDIMALRNYYATFKAFGKTVLDEYAAHLDSVDEYKYFISALQSSKDRMNDLERSMRTLTVDWLFPYFDKLQTEALKTLTEDARKDKYIDKKKFGSLLRYSEKDSAAIDHLFGTLVNSHDPVNATVGILIADIIDQNNNILGHIVSNTKRLRKDYFSDRGITTSEARAAYIKENFLRKARIEEIKKDVYGNVMKDASGKPITEIVERWAFHTEYMEDEIDLAVKAYIESIPKPTPPLGGILADWAAYRQQQKEYYERIATWKEANKSKFLNPAYNKLVSDPMFVFLTTTYRHSNAYYGEAGLKYSIIPQSYIQKNFIENKKSQLQKIKDWITRAKEGKTTNTEKIQGSIKAAIKYVVDGEEQIFYEQANPDESIYRSIKTYYLKPVPEENLNFDLTETIAGFAEDAMHYGSLRDIQANIENMRMLINGGIGTGRKAPKTDSNGNLVWHSIIGKPKSKESTENRLNKQLNGFINDIFYGEKENEVKLSLWSSSKYKEKYAQMMAMVKEQKTPQEIFEATTFYLDDEGRWKTDEYSNVSISLNKIAKNFTFYTSVTSLAGNLMSTGRNLTIGNFVNLSEAHGGKYYDKATYLKAQGIYFRTMPDNIRDMATGERSKLNQLLHDYQAVQGEFRDRYNKLTSDSSIIARLFSTDNLFFLQHAAEHQIQGTASLALMLATKVKTNSGEEMSLWDAYELDERNTVRLKHEIDLKSFDEKKFIRDLHEMNRSNHGNYSDLHKTVIQRQWYGKLLMTFRKHLYPTLKARFGNKKIDYSKGTVVEGYHRLFLRKLGEDIISYGFNLNKYQTLTKSGKEDWTDEEKYGFRRSTFETIWGVLGMMLLTLMLSGDGDDDDDDDTLVKKWLLYTANGLYSDLAMTNPLGVYNPFVNQSEIWQEGKKLSKNPVAVQYSLKRIGDLFNEIGKEDGDVEGKFKKAVPILRHIDAITNPDDYVDNYLKYQSLIGQGTKR